MLVYTWIELQAVEKLSIVLKVRWTQGLDCPTVHIAESEACIEDLRMPPSAYDDFSP